MEIGIEEARKQLGDLVSRAQYGRETIHITRYGRRVAAITPLEDTMTGTITPTHVAALTAEGTDTYHLIVCEADEQTTPTADGEETTGYLMSDREAADIDTGIPADTDPLPSMDDALDGTGWERVDEPARTHNAVYANVIRS